MEELLIITLVALTLILVGCKDTEVTGGVVIEEEIEICKDSDGGINKEVKGILSVEDEDYADACLSGILIEYYCDGDQKANQNIRCPNECKNGKCI